MDAKKQRTPTTTHQTTWKAYSIYDASQALAQHLGLRPGSDNTAIMTALEGAAKAGFLLALDRVASFGEHLKGDKALSDEERYILAQAVEIVGMQAPGEAPS